MTSITKSLFIMLCSALALGLMGCQDSHQDEHPMTAQTSFLIRDATIVDGTGAVAFQGDIRVVGEYITDIDGVLEPTKGDRLIDATGLVVAPGFIDMHAPIC